MQREQRKGSRSKRKLWQLQEEATSAVAGEVAVASGQTLFWDMSWLPLATCCLPRAAFGFVLRPWRCVLLAHISRRIPLVFRFLRLLSLANSFPLICFNSFLDSTSHSHSPFELVSISIIFSCLRVDRNLT